MGKNKYSRWNPSDNCESSSLLHGRFSINQCRPCEPHGKYHLQVIIHVIVPYFGRELSLVIAGRGSENNIPSVAALELNIEPRPIHLKMARLSVFTSEVINVWTGKRVELGSVPFSDGLACFRATTDVGLEHVLDIMGGRKPKEVPTSQWLNTFIENVSSSLSGSFHLLDFKDYGDRYLLEAAYWFNHPFLSDGFAAATAHGTHHCSPQPAARSPSTCSGLRIDAEQDGPQVTTPSGRVLCSVN